MDEQKPQIDPPTPSDAAASAVDPAPDTTASAEPAMAQAGENSRDTDLKKAQAATAEIQPSAPDAPDQTAWISELKRFNEVVNAVLATKELLKLKACDVKIPSEFLGDWTSDSNRFFILAVNLRRRHQNRSATPGTKTDKAA
jgi:hypothetical protein